MKALEMAWETRGKPVGVMFHSDQGAVIIRAGSSGSYCGIPDQAEYESAWKLLG